MDYQKEDLLAEIERLKKSLKEKETGNLFKNSTDYVIALFDSSFNVLHINPLGLEFFDLETVENNSFNLEHILTPKSFSKLSKKVKSLEKKNQLIKIELSFTLLSGLEKFVKGSLELVNPTENAPSYRLSLSDETQSELWRKKHDLHLQVSTLVEKNDTLPVFFREIHKILKKFVPIDSFLAVVKNEPTKQVDIPFHINSTNLNPDAIDGKAFARVAVRLRRPRIYHETKLREIAPKHRIEQTEIFPKTWLAVPFLVKKNAIGALIIQSFNEEEEGNNYSESDLDLLDFISGQLTSAISRRINEQKNSSQSARLEAIFEGGKHLMWSINFAGEFTKFNQNFAKIIWEHYQIFPVEFMPFEKISSKRKYDFYKKWKSSYENAFKGISQQFEINFPNENGVEQWFEIFLNPIYDAKGKEVIEVAGVASNITQKKAFELVLQEREEKFRNIFNSFQDVYFRTDMEGVINMVSPSVFELVGEGHSDVMGKSVTDFYISKRKMEHLRKVLLSEGSVKNFESTLTDKSGEKKTIISNFRIIEDAKGNPLYIEGVARDISELRMWQKSWRKP